jgi:hypothetical protein
MDPYFQISEPFLFNPLKHHLGYIREFIDLNIEDKSSNDSTNLLNDLKYLGRSVMDVYTGSLSVNNICKETKRILEHNYTFNRELFSHWAGSKMDDFRIITLSDDSQWTLKYYNNEVRYVHLFPARSGMHIFRVKSNTLKSALLYHIIIGKDYITGDDLNKVRKILGMSPIKNTTDTEAITEMIEILRESESR